MNCPKCANEMYLDAGTMTRVNDIYNCYGCKIRFFPKYFISINSHLLKFGFSSQKYHDIIELEHNECYSLNDFKKMLALKGFW